MKHKTVELMQSIGFVDIDGAIRWHHDLPEFSAMKMGSF
jgi:hypothetical protein